jgi:gamma-glutamylaminecyclotransferase
MRALATGIVVHNVFVFGTLKEGFPNFGANKGVRVSGEFVTRQKYPLYLVGERFSPWLILDEGKGFNVKGQVFCVSNAALLEMDKLERISEPDGYRRLELPVICAATGDEILAYAYGKPLEQVSEAELRMELAGEYMLEHTSLYRARNA